MPQDTAKTRAGDIFTLGPHRLMCGDATEDADYAALLGDELPDMVFTDPPYGVNIAGARGNIAGDISQAAIPLSWPLILAHTTPTARLYLCGGYVNLALYLKLFARDLRTVPHLICWVKNRFTLSHSGYHNQFEFIYYGARPGGGREWHSSRRGEDASDVWPVPLDRQRDYAHPTQKPVALAARAIRNSAAHGALVLDPFGGSGSTLIACEREGRRCRMMEIDPHYCDVIMARWEKATGGAAIRSDGAPFADIAPSPIA